MAHGESLPLRFILEIVRVTPILAGLMREASESSPTASGGAPERPI